MKAKDSSPRRLYGFDIKALRACVESHYPILYLVTFEDEQCDQVIRRLADDRKVVEWNLALGCVDFVNKVPLTGYAFGGEDEDDDYLDLPAALSNFLKQDDLNNRFIVIRHAHAILPNCPQAVSRLRALVGRIIDDKGPRATIFLVSSRRYIAPELEPFITVFDQDAPDEGEIKRIIDDHAGAYAYSIEDAVVTKLVTACRGLSEYEITRLLNRGYQRNDGMVGADDVELVIEEKKQIVKKSGALEMVSATAEMDEVGGLEGLKVWLRQKAKVMDSLADAKQFGIETPKGMMIVGMPGCGKSLTAKATSALFGLPLLRLDVGALMGRYVGDSEENMRNALRLAETVSPCVLWVDEIEKAFTGIGGNNTGSEITSRLFGYFLTWMQEKTKPVFVVATANNISVLPPELLRKGRFDETFYVDFPDTKEREAILKVHYGKRGRDIKEVDVAALATSTEGFSGADLEGVVKDAIERAFVDGKRKVVKEDLLHAIDSNRPHAEMMEEERKELRKIYETKGIRNASSAQESSLPKVALD